MATAADESVYTAENPAASVESAGAEPAAPPPGAGGTMADAMKEIEEAPTSLEQKLQCVCLNRRLDLDNPTVKGGLAAAGLLILIIVVFPYVAMGGGDDAPAPAPPPPSSGYGGCSSADTRRELAQLTRSSSGNQGVCSDNSAPDAAGLCGSKDKIVVFPFALQFDEAEKFCVDMNGHLASIHDDNEMEALKRATDLAGVTNAVLIGGFEDTLADGTKGPWQWTDGTDMDMAFMNRQRQGRIARQSETSPVDLAGRAPGSPVQPYDNYNQDEDQMAYCGPACCAAPGRELWGVACCTDTGPNPDVDWIHEDPNDLTSETIDYIFHDPEGSQPGSCRCCAGMHDWGRRDQGLVTEHFACRFAPGTERNDGTPSCAPAQMRQELANLQMSEGESNPGRVVQNGDTLQVFPLALRFDDAERFCSDFGGHLASIHSEEEFTKLEEANDAAMVTDAIFVGAFEKESLAHTADNWLWTDGSELDMDLLNAHSWGFDNNGENNEDQMAYCGTGCNLYHGWGLAGAKGFHDWGRRDDGVTTQQFACRFAGDGTLGQYACPDSAVFAQKQCGANHMRRQVAQLTSNSAGNSLDGLELAGGDRIQVMPFALKWNEAQQFCEAVGGNLASIRDEGDYAKLRQATRQAGVTNAVFVGGYNERDQQKPDNSWDHTKDTCLPQQGTWLWSDGTPWDCEFINPKLQGTMNNGQDEDAMAYCGAGCLEVPGREGWSEGFFDWGNRGSGTVSEHFACRIPAVALNTLDATPCERDVLRLELAQMTRASSRNKGRATSRSLTHPHRGPGDLFLVYPMALVFDEADQFCADLGGHLASIHTPGEYLALQAATLDAGVTDAVFIGGYEDECHAGTLGGSCGIGEGEQGTSFAVGTGTSEESCIPATSDIADRIGCARAMTSSPWPAAGSPGPCDEASWPDKDHDLVCGECTVLVDHFSSSYRTCDGYCDSIGRACVAAWEESGDTCTVKSTEDCATEIPGSDALCQCSTALKSESGRPPPPSPPPAPAWGEDREADRATCRAAGNCHFVAGWQWTDGSNMNIEWMETLRPGNIQKCGCHKSEGGWVPDAAAAGMPMHPFDNYGQNENEMAYCGPACCSVPGRHNWGAECCVEDNIDAEWRSEDDGVQDSAGDVVWRRCTPACEADNVASAGHCRQDALNPDIGWGTCAPDKCAQLPGCEPDVPCSGYHDASGSLLPPGCTMEPDAHKCDDPARCGFNSGLIWAFGHYVTQTGHGANGRNGVRDSCRCCEGMHDWGRRDQGTVSQHFACRFPQ